MPGKDFPCKLPHFVTKNVATPLFDVVGEVLFGMLGLGLLQWLLGLADAILFCAVLFAAAIVVVLGVDERRGGAAADAWLEPSESAF